MKCKQAKKESSRPPNTVQPAPKPGQPAPKLGTKGIKTVKSIKKPLDFLYPDTNSETSDSSVGMVRIEDKDSRPSKVVVTIQGIPAQGVIDSGVDITIINDLFKNIAAAAKLRKKAFKQPVVIEPLECELDAGLYVGNSLVQTTSDDKAQVVITNLSPFT